MKIKTKLFFASCAAATLLGTVSAGAFDLLEKYPTALTAGDAKPENARVWEFNAADVYHLSRFNLEVGKDFKVELGAADVGIAHCKDGAVWAVVIPEKVGKLTSTASKEPEQILHVWLRFHPKEIGHVFPSDTVSAGSATNLMQQMRDVAAVKFRSSWHAGQRAMIPEPKDMTVDADTKGGPRRFFMVNTEKATAEYVAAFEEQSAQPVNASLETAPPVVVKTVPVAGATDVGPALNEIRVSYSRPMRDGSWSWSTWGEENYPETTGSPKYLGDGRTCVLPVKLQPNKFYAIWLNSDKFKNFKGANGRPAVPYLLTFTTGEAVGGGSLIERSVEKLVSDFPTTEDLSTPESACAAWQRAVSKKDVATICRLSLTPLNPKEEQAWFDQGLERDPEGMAIYLKALAESKIVSVQIYRGELANVITYLSFPKGKGTDPYSARFMGLVNGAWKNLGEDRLPDLESAKSNFANKKERMWPRYAELKAKAVSQMESPKNEAGVADATLTSLNEDQRAVLAWTDRQFRSFFDSRSFDGWSEKERADLETRLIDTLSGPQTREYYQAINTLGAMKSTKALPKLRAIAFERVDRNNRDRWMAVRALGIMGDKASVPELIHLVYHGNQNTHWWAQITLVQLTGQNFGKDWNAWGKWWNESKGEPPYKPEIIRWWSGQPEPEKLAASLEESDQKFLSSLE